MYNYFSLGQLLVKSKSTHQKLSAFDFNQKFLSDQFYGWQILYKKFNPEQIREDFIVA